MFGISLICYYIELIIIKLIANLPSAADKGTAISLGDIAKQLLLGSPCSLPTEQPILGSCQVIPQNKPTAVSLFPTEIQSRHPTERPTTSQSKTPTTEVPSRHPTEVSSFSLLKKAHYR